MRDQNQPLSHTELLTFREQRAIIPGPRSDNDNIDFSKCGLAHAYGSPGEVMSNTTSPRRRALAA